MLSRFQSLSVVQKYSLSCKIGRKSQARVLVSYVSDLWCTYSLKNIGCKAFSHEHFLTLLSLISLIACDNTNSLVLDFIK